MITPRSMAGPAFFSWSVVNTLANVPIKFMRYVRKLSCPVLLDLWFWTICGILDTNRMSEFRSNKASSTRAVRYPPCAAANHTPKIAITITFRPNDLLWYLYINPRRTMFCNPIACMQHVPPSIMLGCTHQDANVAQPRGIWYTSIRAVYTYHRFSKCIEW